jgi:predicted nucleic acid-binding protein
LRETSKTSLSSQRGQSLGGLELTEIVIDSSILAKFILRESVWGKAKDIISKRPYTLELAVKEVVNAIWKRVTLIKDINVEKAFVLLSDLLELKKRLLVVEPQDWYLSQALEISIKEEIPVYDSLFIAQAVAKQATLATSDRRQCQVAEKLNVKTLCI